MLKNDFVVELAEEAMDIVVTSMSEDEEVVENACIQAAILSMKIDAFLAGLDAAGVLPEDVDRLFDPYQSKIDLALYLVPEDMENDES